MAEEKKQEMLDPVAYRSDYNPSDVQEEFRWDPNLPWVWPLNANENYQEYGDDSNPAWQGQRGWLNPKYEWEGTANTYIDYNPDLTIADLDPNYLYWENARQQNSKEKWYIARRNDNIASALYNEWLVGREDVAKFLWQQSGWMDSTEEDRLNTIESIWKRLWQIQPKEEEEQPDLSRAEEIRTDTSGKIYWKTTAEEWKPSKWIDTLADANSVFKAMEENRIANVKQLASMDSEKVWYLMSEWMSPFSEQTMRDLQQYYPEKYNAIQTALKNIKGQQNIDSISTGWALNITSQLDASENNVTTSMNDFVDKTATGSGAWTLATNLNNALAESKVVSTARWQMEEYKRKIQEIQDAANELPTLANKYFKWDVPQYMVNAFINNRMQAYNKELEKYQNLYNATLDEAKWEVSQNQWREEMNYKWTSLQADQNYKNANLELSKQELALKMMKEDMANWQWNDDGSYSYMDLNGVMHTIPKAQAEKIFNTDLYNKSTAYIEYWKNAIEKAKSNWLSCIWWQCEWMTDNYAKQNFWTEMKKADWSTWATTVDEKARYATEALPERWYVAVFDFWKVDADWVNRWHTWIVIDYDPTTWNFTCLESNVDGNWKVEIKTRNINSANLLWFRDPTVAEPRNKGANWTVVDPYYDFPMVDVYTNAYNDAEWVDAKNKVLSSRKAYGILYNMKKDWGLEEVIDDEVAEALDEYNQWVEDLWKLIQQWWQNAYLSSILDNDWNFVVSTMMQYLMNTWKLKISQEKKAALDDLLQVIQIKLRWESWAAINVSEWQQDYNLFLPQIWQDRKWRLKRISELEHSIASSYLPWDYVKQYIPIITQEMIDNEDIDKTVVEIMEQQMNK